MEVPKYFLNIAGGFTKDADINNVVIEMPNGQSRQMNRFWINKDIIDGSIIRVPEKEKSEPLDGTELAKDIASIIGDIAQVLSIMIIAYR